ncbi:MAG: tRNA guanosine(34) transglycosylase Tgt [bacterium]|nr:tRNA guanosine(34) transglycosylase Tgt [bacterium]
MIEFKILKKSKKSEARLGLLKTEHGVVETPCLVPVATQATVKALTFEQVERTKTQILISNAFHLHLKPGEDVIKKAGGLNKFSGWEKPFMTDSGGFQVLSLGFGMDCNVGKILKQDRKTIQGANPKNLKIMEEGVFFKSPVDGKELFLGPKESIKIQEKLGTDIIFAFDECTSPLASKEYVEKSLEKTHKWAGICLKAKKSKQSLFGIIQGGRFRDLRKRSAKLIGGLDFDGFGIGGEFGNNKKKMTQMINWVLDELPEKKPRHLLGIGYIEDILPIIKSGVDTFDCIVPTRFGRHGTAFTSQGKLDLTKSKFLKENKPLDKNCGCDICQKYTRSYICHLMKAKEITALSLITFHNLYFFNSYIEKIRNDIKSGKI